MAEKGIVVDDAASGESVACYDAVENDNDSNARIIQLVDRSQRKHGFDITTEAGLVRNGVTTSDTVNLTPVPAAITDNALTVGDKTTLVATVRYKSQNNSTEVTITPIVLDDDNAVVGFLTPKVFQGFQPDDSDDMSLIVDISSTPWNITEMLSWDVLGAYKIGFHVTANNGAGTTEIDVYAAMITGPAVGDRAVAYPLGGSNATKDDGSGA